MKLLTTLALAGGLMMTGLAAHAAVDADSAQALLKKSDCFKCHSVDKKKDGPAFKEVAKKYKLNDDLVEHIFLFSSLHDIGKIGISDSILLKAGKLTEAEFDTMKTHASKGGEIIDMMLKNLGFDEFPHAEILRNIALYHHEAINGSGYNGLIGEEIPVEAKIVAVADVFDALTSVRPYKEAWSNERAFLFLQSMAGTKFDSDCVAALINMRDEVEAIQMRFKEDHIG